MQYCVKRDSRLGKNSPIFLELTLLHDLFYIFNECENHEYKLFYSLTGANTVKRNKFYKVSI